MRTVLQSPIAALTAVCISMPAGVSVANFASTDAATGSAPHSTAAPEVALAAATSGLKLVFANVGSNPGVGAAATNAGQKIEMLALPQKLADNVAANGTVGLANTVVDAGRQAAANILEEANQASLLADTPTDNVLTRGLLGLWDIALWINNSAQTAPLPPGFSAATYTSVLKVISNFVQVGVLPFTVANMLLQGQWDQILPTITNTSATAFTSLFVGLPTSFVQTLNWVFTGNPPGTTTAAAATVNSLQANQASLLADTPTDNVLTRGLLGLWDISVWINNSAQTAPLPPGFTAATYTSVLKVISNFVQVGVLPFTVANMALQGQWDAIPATINTAVTTAFNSLTQGLPTSFTQTLNWVLTGATPSTTTAVNSLLKASAVGGEASGQDELGKVDDGTTPGGTTGGGTTPGGTTTGGTTPGGTTPGATTTGGTTTGGTTPGGGTTGGGTTTRRHDHRRHDHRRHDHRRRHDRRWHDHRRHDHRRHDDRRHDTRRRHDRRWHDHRRHDHRRHDDRRHDCRRHDHRRRHDDRRHDDRRHDHRRQHRPHDGGAPPTRAPPTRAPPTRARSKPSRLGDVRPLHNGGGGSVYRERSACSRSDTTNAARPESATRARKERQYLAVGVCLVGCDGVRR